MEERSEGICGKPVRSNRKTMIFCIITYLNRRQDKCIIVGVDYVKKYLFQRSEPKLLSGLISLCLYVLNNRSNRCRSACAATSRQLAELRHPALHCTRLLSAGREWNYVDTSCSIIVSLHGALFRDNNLILSRPIINFGKLRLIN